jgi:nitrogen fixation/metabolism regulation signal transduction histidine kinase
MSLGRRLSMLLAMFAALLAVGYVTVGAWYMRRQMDANHHAAARLLLSAHEQSLSRSVLTGNTHDIPGHFQTMRQTTPAMRYGFVTDSQGQLIAYSAAPGRHLPAELVRIAREQTAQGEDGFRTIALEGDRILHYTQPLESPSLGYASIGLSWQPVESKLRLTMLHLSGSMLLLLSAVILVAWLLYRRINQPVRELTGTVVAFGQGDLQQRVNLSEPRPDEIGLLAHEFNGMAERLQRTVDELRQSQAELEEEKERIQAILDGLEQGVVFRDLSGRVAYRNAAAIRYWSEPTEATSGGEAKDDTPETAEAREAVLAGAEETRRVQISSGERTLVVYFVALRRESGERLGVIELIADITEQMQTARALAHAEKLNVVGQLSAGVAHEINSPLDGALETARLLAAEDLPADRIPRFAKAQENALNRIAAIVRRLLTFARSGEAPHQPVALHAITAEAAEMIAFRLRRKDLQLDLPDDGGEIPVVDGDPLGLSQVLVNLLTNAADASPNNGTIRVRLDEQADEVVLRVTDQGPGVPDDVRDKMFSPFFTTKDIGQGTGLGLAVSLNIVKDHGGTMEVRNESPPWGATILVRLPWQGRRLAATEITPFAGIART